MTAASIWTPNCPASIHFGAKTKRTASTRLKRLSVPADGATPGQWAEGKKYTTEWNAHFCPLEKELISRGITNSAERFTKFALKIRDASSDLLEAGGDGWVPISELRYLLNRKKPLSVSWVDKAKRPLLALRIIDIRPGYARYLGPPPSKKRFRSVSGKLSGYKTAQNPSFKASQPAGWGAISLIGNAEGEPPAARHAKRNAQGRFAPAHSNQTKGASPQKATEPKRRSEPWDVWGYCPSRVQKGPPPPCPMTDPQLDELDAELSRKTVCLQEKPKASRPAVEPSDVSSEVAEAPVELHQGEEPGAYPSTLAAAPCESHDVSSVAPMPEQNAKIQDAELGRVARGAGAEFAAALAAFRAKAVPERPDDGHDPLPPPGPPPKPNRPLPPPKPRPAPATSAKWIRVDRGGTPSREWIADVFGGTRYADLSFGAIRRLQLDCGSLLAARALCDGRKGVTENWSGLLVAAAKRLQMAQWLMLGQARQPGGHAVAPGKGGPQG